jgi:hypothetical protein
MKWLAACLAVCAATSAMPALAQTQEAPKQPVQRVKLRALLADGYELKNVVFVPQDASSRIAAKPDHDALVISLQKGSAIATCYHQLRNYVAGEVLDIEWCVPHR